VSINITPRLHYKHERHEVVEQDIGNNDYKTGQSQTTDLKQDIFADDSVAQDFLGNEALYE